ncbi:Phage protein (N4 Gp49/phage Sf6 gene 66) family protein [Methylobacillus rhizosphaerae]|uniref:Phage protein (N4 Gp49/phage Sf6 gene 66) family protein n=1 Tax=Methylobacillus rhizosphaerae TaxID=551994 RepID=A0A239AU24_9PROT|nr:Gp49 family protein [Methylobacillus rhizosphaerae]SNR98822.1 Phage protein (N4 Gp49/phage Sf6 gene 66) family protein [Methylobacillus rhizosphaerae]
MATDSQIEQEIQDKGLTAPRVTPADIEAAIRVEAYFTAGNGIEHSSSFVKADIYEEEQIIAPLDLLTFCVLVLRNGFTVTGESACASPENFDAEIGRKIARQNAVAKIWPLLGYELRSKLYRPEPDLNGPILTEADAEADLRGEPRPDNPAV